MKTILRLLIGAMIGTQMVAQPSFAAESNVVQLHDFRKAKSCLELFKAPREKINNVISFVESVPDYVETRPFLTELQAWHPPEVVYFYHSNSSGPPFARGDTGAWSKELHLNQHRDIYILKAEKYTQSWWPWEQGVRGGVVLTAKELRENYRMVSYTRVRVPEVFHMIYKIIYFIRGVESERGAYFYSNVSLDLTYVLREGSLADNVIGFIHSWKDALPREQAMKELLVERVKEHSRDGDFQSVEVFMKDLREEMNALYPPGIFPTFSE